MLKVNLKNLRERKGHTQTVMANLLSISRSTYINYEKGNTDPPASFLIKIAKYHNVSIDGLLTQDLVNPLFNQQIKKDHILANEVRILSITLSKDEKQNIEFVSAKAIAGYLVERGSINYISDLPKIHIPKLPEGSYRAFEIQGTSMPPIQDGYIVIGRFIEHARDLTNGRRYILVLRENGIVFKRVTSELNNNERLILSSDNTEFEPFTIKAINVLEAWELVAFIGFPDKLDMNFFILDKLHEMEQKINLLISSTG